MIPKGGTFYFGLVKQLKVMILKQLFADWFYLCCVWRMGYYSDVQIVILTFGLCVVWCGVVWEPQLSAMTFLVSEHAVAEIIFIQARFLKTFSKGRNLKSILLNVTDAFFFFFWSC